MFKPEDLQDQKERETPILSNMRKPNRLQKSAIRNTSIAWWWQRGLLEYPSPQISQRKEDEIDVLPTKGHPICTEGANVVEGEGSNVNLLNERQGDYFARPKGILRIPKATLVLAAVNVVSVARLSTR